MQVGDKVKQKNTSVHRIGIIVGIWEDDEYYETSEGANVLFASKGELKVRFELDELSTYQTFSSKQLILL